MGYRPQPRALSLCAAGSVERRRRTTPLWDHHHSRAHSGRRRSLVRQTRQAARLVAVSPPARSTRNDARRRLDSSAAEDVVPLLAQAPRHCDGAAVSDQRFSHVVTSLLPTPFTDRVLVKARGVTLAPLWYPHGAFDCLCTHPAVPRLRSSIQRCCTFKSVKVCRLAIRIKDCAGTAVTASESRFECPAQRELLRDKFRFQVQFTYQPNGVNSGEGSGCLAGTNGATGAAAAARSLTPLS